jgi:hypothetical protein
MSRSAKLKACCLIALTMSLPAAAQGPCGLGDWGQTYLEITIVSHCSRFYAQYTCGGIFGDEVSSYTDWYVIAPVCQNS